MIKSRRMRWAEHAECMEEKRNAYRVFLGKPVGKKPVRCGYMWEDSIKMDLREIGWGGMDWTQLAQDRDQ
jgi:hypothetical protein